MTDCITGIVVGAVLGVLFLFTCIISAIKAVKDRKRIKRNIAERKQNEAEVEFTLSNFSNGTLSSKSSKEHASEKILNEQANVQNSEKNDNANHSIFKLEEKQGIENNFFTDLDEEIEKPPSASLPTTSKSSENIYLGSRVSNSDNECVKPYPFSQLSTESIAIQKVLRRYSYKVAVEHNSLIPEDPLLFASSRAILYPCDYGNPSIRAFENKAFNYIDL